MANETRTVAIRLVVENGDKIRADLQAVGQEGERSLAVIDRGAASASRSLVSVADASGAVSTAHGKTIDESGRVVAGFDQMAGAADRTSRAVATIPTALQLLAGIVAIDVAIRSVGLLRDGVVWLGKEAIDAGKAFNAWAADVGGSTNAAVQYLEFYATRAAAVKALEVAGVGVAGRAAAYTIGSAAYIGVEAIAALADASKAARDHAEQQKALSDELDRTGHASQRTAGDINALAKSIADGTKFTESGVTTAATEMLKFRRVFGDSFDEAVKQSAGLAAKLGLDLPAAARLLGGALNDPVAGLTKLADVGVNLTFKQEQLIKQFQEAGDVGKAQAIILEAVATKAGDAATKMTDAERASKAMQSASDNLSVAIGSRLNSILDTLASNWRSVGAAIKEALAPLSAGAAAGMEALAAAIRPDAASVQLAATTKRVSDLRQQERDLSARASTLDDQQQLAWLGQEIEIAERKRRQLEQQVNAERRALEGERREIGQRQTDEGDRKASLIKPDKPTGGRGGRSDTEDATDHLENYLQRLRDQNRLLGLEEGERARIKALMEGQRIAMQDGVLLTEQQAAEISLLATSIHDAESAQRRYNAAQQDSKRFGEEVGRTLSGGLADAITKSDSLTASLKNVANALLRIATNAAMKPIESKLGGLFGDLFGGIFGGGSSLNPMNAALTGTVPMMTPLGYGQGFHTGGIIGDAPTFTRSMPADTWHGAPRYHSGGLAGDEVPAILQKGEGVFTRGQMAALGAGGAGGNVFNANITVNVNGGDGGAGGNPDDRQAMARTIGSAVRDQVKTWVAQELRTQSRPGGMMYGR